MTNNLADGAEFDMVFVNTEFVEEISDHEPLIARLSFGGDELGETIVGGDDDEDLVGGTGDDTIAGGLGADTILGSDGADVLRGDLNSRNSQVGIGNNDIIFGGAGDDRIGGKAGDDTLFGGSGDDQMWGDDGDDILRGGLGNDILVGDDASSGQGADTFVLALDEGTHTIWDFEIGTDTLQVLGVSTLADLTDGNTIAVGEAVLAELQGVDTTTLTAADFEFSLNSIILKAGHGIFMPCPYQTVSTVSYGQALAC